VEEFPQNDPDCLQHILAHCCPPPTQGLMEIRRDVPKAPIKVLHHCLNRDQEGNYKQY